jgi:hypothetical protein
LSDIGKNAANGPRRRAARRAVEPSAHASAAPQRAARGAHGRRHREDAGGPPAGVAPPRDTQDRPAPSGVELVGTAIQAAGELAQMGAAIGTQALKSALGRLGR